MSDLLPCPFCGGANLGLLRHVRYFPHGVICQDCYASATSIERWSARALPVARADAAAIREAALRDAIALAEGTTKYTLASRAGDNRVFTIIKGLEALIDKPGKETSHD